jgi:hypothetical protein
VEGATLLERKSFYLLTLIAPFLFPSEEELGYSELALKERNVK